MAGQRRRGRVQYNTGMLGKALLLTLAVAMTAPAADEAVSFRIVFGERRDRPADYSGSIQLTAGRVTRLAPWRFFGGDAIEGERAWKLTVKKARFENQPDAPRPMMTGVEVLNVVPAGVVVTAEAPESAIARVRTAQGNFDLPLRELEPGRVLEFLGGDVVAQRTPVVERVSPVSERDPAEQFDYPSVAVAEGRVWVAWQGYHDRGDHVYAREWREGAWGETERLTQEKGDIYRTAVGVDGKGRVWVVWAERFGRDWDLYARRGEGGEWGRRVKLTSANHPNIFHRVAGDDNGRLHLVWVGHTDGESYVYWSRLEGDNWSSPRAISGPSAWNPEAALDSRGNLWVVWDSYRNGNYDIYLRQVGADGALGPEQQVSKSALYQTHATVAVDRQDRVWVAWHESGPNWGKDWTHEDGERSTVLYRDRRPAVAVLEGGVWKQPVGELMGAVPLRYRRYVQYPRLAVDRTGRVWCGLQLRVGTAHNRSDWWAFDGRWEHFLTALEGEAWRPLMPVPESSLRPEGPLLLAPDGDGIRLVWTSDNRPVFASAFYARIPNRHEVWTARLSGDGPGPAPVLEKFEERRVNTPPVHPDEEGDLKRIRGYRVTLNGQTLRILRGDFHRHTEISSDGAGDGSLEDFYRYMIDAAGMETGIVADHNAGNDDEYCWWRTEKAADLFLIPGRYTPMFGYERSPNYPNGHRNMVFAQRGVRTLPIPAEEQRGRRRTGPVLYPYLKKHNGIAMVHSSATSQGTDWGDNDPEVEPLVELYQGYHASYEYEGAPRAESPKLRVAVHGRYEPAGFWWNALKKGYKLGVQASSDHISTHTSYTLIYSPGMSREQILESMRARHAYAATDNIIVDFQAETADGRRYLMGDAFGAAEAPVLKVRIAGTDVVTVVDVIKDQKFVYHAEPNAVNVEFTYRDTEPGRGESYYYVRVQQRDRNLAWSSPVWVNYGSGAGRQ